MLTVTGANGCTSTANALVADGHRRHLPCLGDAVAPNGCTSTNALGEDQTLPRQATTGAMRTCRTRHPHQMSPR